MVGSSVTYCVAGKSAEVVEPAVHLARHRVEVRDLLDLVAEEGDPVGGLERRRLHLDDVAAHAEAAAAEERVVALVLDSTELAQHLVAIELLPDGQEHRLLAVLGRRAEPVDARDRGDDDDVAAQRAARSSPHAGGGRCRR